MDYKEMEDSYVAPTYGRRDLTIVRGDGCILYDDDGRQYIDCFSNVGVNILGHNVPEYNQAVIMQLSKLINLHGSFYNDKRAEFAKRLLSVCPKDLTKVLFCNSGSESVEAALKFSRLSTGRKEILSAKMGYHGKTFGSLSVTTTNPKYRESFVPLLDDVKHFSYNDAESLRSVISDKTAAVILEPIQGESGIRLGDMRFMQQVREICDEFGALMIVDEVQSGMGRTGKMFAIEWTGVSPDIMCLAKGLAGGIPAGATVINDKVTEKMFPGCHTNTFGGNPLVCAAGIAVLDYIETHNLLKHAEDAGEHFMKRLREMDSPKIREVRGVGLMIGVELKEKATGYIKALQDNGVLAFPSGNLVIRFLPPLTITQEQIDTVVEKFAKVLA